MEPRLQSFSLRADAPRLTWRLLVPPNLAVSAPRDKIPLKVEAEIAGIVRPPVGLGGPFSLDAPDVLAALLLEEWSGGAVPALAQLTREQFRQLLTPLQGQPCVFWLKEPQKPLKWEGSRLPGISEHLVGGYAVSRTTDSIPLAARRGATVGSPMTSASGSKTAIPEAKKGALLPTTPTGRRLESVGLFRERAAQNRPIDRPSSSAMEVDGSPEFISIALPSRESALYADALALVKSNGFSLDAGLRRYFLRGRHATLNFLADHTTTLRETFRAHFSANFEARLGQTLPRATAKVEAKELAPGDFDVEVSLEVPGVDAIEIDRALSRGQRYVDTPRGPVLLEAKVVRDFHELQRRLASSSEVPLLGKARRVVRAAELTAMEDALTEISPAFQPPEAWRSRSQALRQRDALPRPQLDATLASCLRDYQWLGVAWLWHLFRSRLGGILADEMGLGKTVQALALLSLVDRAEEGRQLVVCPASLLENWRREALRFVPGLPVRVHHGGARATAISDFPDRGLIITSYGTLTRDDDLLKTIPWGCVVADEAQHVKNRRSQAAKALRSLAATGRFVLTGTPLENSPADLASLFDFLLPGYLPPTPTGSRSAEEQAWQHQLLRDRAAPYLLRRTKAAVAKELPPKVERVLYCELTPEQERLYRAVQQSAEQELLSMAVSGANEGQQRLAVFRQLTRLRQVCAEPRILDDTLTADHSTKWNAFREILDECLDGGHRILVFSQFTRVLGHLRQELDALNVPYAYLDGQTRDRQGQVDAFNQNDTIPVFLISLKAGGVGLNLTGADTVVLFDPWWNPAAEAQAIDRAHRIGQDRSVTAIRLVATGTIEEKILALQQKKAAWLADLFEAAEGANASVSFEDLRGLLAET